MNVALVYQNFAHYRSAVLCELWKRGRHRYTFASDLTDIDNPTIKPWDFPKDFPHRRIRARKLLGLTWHSGVIALARSNEFDAIVLLGNAAWPAFWLAAFVARARGKRVLFWTHGWTHRDRWPFGWIRKTFYSLADFTMLYGHFGKMLAIERGMDPSQLHVIYNSLDYAAQLQERSRITQVDLIEMRRQIFNDAETPIAICSTRLTPQRRLDILFQAILTLKNRGKIVNVLLIGDGPEKSNLESLAQKLQINIHFYGPCYDESILARLTMASNVTVAPGQVGLTAMQSLGYGTPIVTHDDWLHQMPEFESITDGVTGSLVKRDDVDSLAGALEKWTRTQFTDESTRAACYRMIERFYNPIVQRLLIERAIDGELADDLYNARCAKLNQVRFD